MLRRSYSECLLNFVLKEYLTYVDEFENWPIAKNTYCSRDIYLQLERSVITLVIIHSTQKKLVHWLL